MTTTAALANSLRIRLPAANMADTRAQKHKADEVDDDPPDEVFARSDSKDLEEPQPEDDSDAQEIASGSDLELVTPPPPKKRKKHASSSLTKKKSTSTSRQRAQQDDAGQEDDDSALILGEDGVPIESA